MKIRIKFDTIEQASDQKSKYGGWIAWENGFQGSMDRVYWYDYQHTQSEIMDDLKGSYAIQ